MRLIAEARLLDLLIAVDRLNPRLEAVLPSSKIPISIIGTEPPLSFFSLSGI